MTTTAAHSSLGHGRIPQRHLSPAFDRFIAQLGMSMLRWAKTRSRRRAISHEQHETLRALDSERVQRELTAQRLTAMRGF